MTRSARRTSRSLRDDAPPRGVRRARHLDAARRGRRPARRSSGCSRCSTAARRRPASPSATATGPGCTRTPGSSPTSSPTRRSTPLTGYHAIGHTRYSHDRRERSATSSRSSSRRCTARWPSPTTATSSTRRRCATSCSPRGFGLTATSDSEVMTLMLAAAGGTHVGGAHRAHAAGVEGRLLARAARRRPGARGARPVGLPAAVGRPPAARRPRRRQRDVRPVDARLRRHRRGPARRDRHAAGRRAAPPPGARAGAASRPAARSSSSTSPGPTRCGTAATCTTSASGSAPSWPPSRRSTPTS